MMVLKQSYITWCNVKHFHLVSRVEKIHMKPVRDISETSDSEHTTKTTVVHLESVGRGVELEHDDITTTEASYVNPSCPELLTPAI